MLRCCDAPATPLIRNLKWLPVTDIIRSETATVMYKSLNGLAPEYLSKSKLKRPKKHDNGCFPALRKTLNGQKAVSFRGSKLWNNLEPHVKQEAPSLATFKKT